LVDAHGGVDLLVRDAASQGVAQDLLGVPATLVPDLAYSLGPWPTPATQELDVLWALRRDKEALMPALARATEDWPRDRELALRAPAFGALLLAERATRAPLVAGRPAADRLGRELVVPLASARLSRGRHWLGRARRVVTDRLHVHVLAAAMDIPHVVVDSRTHKLIGAVTTWPGWPSGRLAIASAPTASAVEAALERLEDGT
jgi:pyruvyl transferase EpsO